MVNVLVIGASGYIGNGVAIALRRGGHRVWGLVRKSQQAHQLKLNEIIPIIGDINDAKTYEPYYDLVSHIIDATGFSSGPSSQILHDSIFAYAKKPSHRKITFLYTSGVSVYGTKDDGLLKHEDIHSLDAPAFTAAVAATEEKILHNNDINGVTIRNGWVFGGTGGGFIDHLFAFDSVTGDFEYKGSPDKIWQWIHINDLADLYLKIVEAPTAIVAHQSFNSVNDSKVKLIDVRTAFARAAGATGKVIVKPADPDPFSQLFESVLLVSNEKAKRLLKWTPKFELIDEAKIFYHSWKAAQDAKKIIDLVILCLNHQFFNVCPRLNH